MVSLLSTMIFFTFQLFQFEQEIPFFNKKAEKFVGENRLKFVFNIDNVLNFIDSDLGTQLSGPGFDAIDLVRADLVTAADVAANGVDGATACISSVLRLSL